MRQIVSSFVLAIALALVVLGQTGERVQNHQMTAPDKAEMKIYPATDVQWKEGPASLPAGAKFAVLEGDPTKEGVFTMRLSLPDGFKIPPHWHSNVEHVTVVSGTFNVGMGEKFDETATRVMPAGTFAFWPAGMRHFAWAKGETVLQLHGVGPWTITYVNPSDDPRKAKQ
jgi:quercetin dioxygenase-like cupin family protein